MIRIYDNRFRKTFRSPEVYLKCGDVLGKSTEILHLEAEAERHIIDGFNASDGTLTILSTPYQKGGHQASEPTDFVPIILQLQKLHNEGYVHGDIRGFNTVYAGNNSCLIDFDFGGRENEVKYPPGYKGCLEDGVRVGVANENIKKYHDWWALGQLIFYKYILHPPETLGQSNFAGLQGVIRCELEEMDESTNFGDEFVNKWICLLEEAQKKHYKLCPIKSFSLALGEN